MTKRFFRSAVKLLVYVLFVVISYLFLFVALIWITGKVPECGIVGKLVREPINQGNDIVVFVTAAATLEFAVLTMLQQHITRQQDRALEFPDVCVEQCELITSLEKVMDEMIGIDAISGKYIIKTTFNQTFPVYYMPKIYRSWIRLRKYQSVDTVRKLKVLSSTFKTNKDNAVWSIQVDENDYILDTVERSQIGKIQSLDFIYDVGWENRILPWPSSSLTRIYMRMIIRLNDVGVRTDYGCNIGVRDIEIMKAPICGVKT